MEVKEEEDARHKLEVEDSKFDDDPLEASNVDEDSLSTSNLSVVIIYQCFMSNLWYKIQIIFLWKNPCVHNTGCECQLKKC